MKIAVVGRGLIGSAAARHLAEAGLAPTLIGPSEPADYSTHDGVFASHYDEGRVTRKNATDGFWSRVSQASIARYHQIERASGVTFFNDVGALMVGADAGSFLNSARDVTATEAVSHADLAPGAFAAQFPDLTFSGDTAALWESGGAGHISPRRLVAAQTKAAEIAGATLSDMVVDSIEETPNGIHVNSRGSSLRFDRVLIAAGAMTDHVLGRAVTYEVRPRTITFFHLSEEEAARLSALPSAVFDTGHYLLPPIRYPDGSMRMKLGGEPDCPPLTHPGEIAAWFKSGGSADVSAAHQIWFQAHLPDVRVDQVSRGPCVTAWTRDTRPELQKLTDRLAVAAGGNGAGAKCSDELGRLGAMLISEDLQERRAS